MRPLAFGVFDHVDRSDLPLADYYEERLKLIQAYDRLGFHAYHLAEHHSTPLGMAPSPSVFMAAIAQRTERLRFGPMVYALPLYHPLRMIEEICMLDHLSRGRIEIGFGRGSSPNELRLFGQDPAEAQAVYTEALEFILKGLTERTLDFSGKFFRADNVPMELEPLQKPHPPVWYGVHAPESAERAARRGLKVIHLDNCKIAAECYGRFRNAWRESQAGKPLPLMGIGRFVVVAGTDAEARSLAERAYPRWHANFTHLHRLTNYVPSHPRAPTWEGLVAEGRGIAGSPATVTRLAREHLEETGANYLVGQFAFGDLGVTETHASVELFAAEVMPALCESIRELPLAVP
jgi:alkanesulfonate monooxygenase SsuD/methylene tetrahydromethanopterin reductase-like flavin-dependent oxidoreductase (luciferase family)